MDVASLVERVFSEVEQLVDEERAALRCSVARLDECDLRDDTRARRCSGRPSSSPRSRPGGRKKDFT